MPMKIDVNAWKKTKVRYEKIIEALVSARDKEEIRKHVDFWICMRHAIKSAGAKFDINGYIFDIPRCEHCVINEKYDDSDNDYYMDCKECEYAYLLGMCEDRRSRWSLLQEAIYSSYCEHAIDISMKMLDDIKKVLAEGSE